MGYILAARLPNQSVKITGYVFIGYMKKAENGQTKTVAYITQTNQTGDVQ